MSHNLVISYDLDKPGQNYEKVIEQIKALGDWAKIHKSVWYVKSKLNADKACDFLRKVIDGNDTVFVADTVENNASWFNVSEKASDYIVSNWSK